MKYILYIVVLSIIASSQENVSIGKLEYDKENGAYVQTITDLVHMSELIIRGHYGQVVSQQFFTGYNKSKSDLANRFDISQESLDALGFPITDYEIIIDELIKGDTNIGNSIIHRVVENPENAYKEEYIRGRTGDFLFFMVINPDNQTYSVLGNMFVMKNLDGKYTYSMNGRRQNAFEMNISADDFLNAISSEILLQ